MKAEELSEALDKIIEKNFGIETNVCLQVDEGTIMKKFIVTDDLQSTLREKIRSIIEDKYLTEEAIESSVNLAENKNALYDFELSEEYNPFLFLNDWASVEEQFDGEDRSDIIGFVFKINFNADYFWAYQQVYPMSLLNKSKNIYALIGKNKVYDEVKSNLIAIAARIDLIIVNNHVITSNTGLMQNKFGYDVVIRNEAQSTIDYIVDLGLVTNSEKLKAFIGKEKLTNAKKLMKAKNSPVLLIEKESLIRRIQSHSRYKEMVEIENGEIKTDTLKAVTAFVKMLNDDILKSELSDVEYDSSAKTLLEPIEK